MMDWKSHDHLKVTATGKRLVFLSDIHLGHPRTPTSVIIENLYTEVFNTEVMTSIDGIIISGDLFDRQISLAKDDSREIMSFAFDIIKLSIKTKTPIRILEGTHSHDWHQSELFTTMNKKFKVPADLEFISKLSIVKDKSLGLTIGYIPDDWSESHQQTTDEFSELLKTKGIRKVDLIIMHGMFDFQVPTLLSNRIATFDSSIWSTWAKYGIIIGHDHNPKDNGFIYVPGSFDCMGHGEEGIKGYLLGTIINDTLNVERIINKNYLPYITIDGSNLTDTEIYAELKNTISWINKRQSGIISGYIRIKYNSKYDITGEIEKTKKDNPNIRIRCDRVTVGDDVSLTNPDFKIVFDTIDINPENIKDIIMRRIGTSCNAISSIIEQIK